MRAFLIFMILVFLNTNFLFASDPKKEEVPAGGGAKAMLVPPPTPLTMSCSLGHNEGEDLLKKEEAMVAAAEDAGQGLQLIRAKEAQMEVIREFVARKIGEYNEKMKINGVPERERVALVKYGTACVDYIISELGPKIKKHLKTQNHFRNIQCTFGNHLSFSQEDDQTLADKFEFWDHFVLLHQPYARVPKELHDVLPKTLIDLKAQLLNPVIGDGGEAIAQALRGGGESLSGVEEEQKEY